MGAGYQQFPEASQERSASKKSMASNATKLLPAKTNTYDTKSNVKMAARA
jgi:hypothetical protein